MQKKQTTLPEPVMTAVNALLAPFGQSVETLSNSQNSNGLKEYLTVAEAEEYCGLGRWSLIRAHQRGELPVYKMSNARAGKLLYRKTDIDKMMSKKMRKTYIRGGVS